MTRTLFAFLATLLLAAPAAAFEFTDCSGNTTGELYSITGYNLVCISVAPADGITSTPKFTVQAKEAKICFDPALDDAGADDGEAVVWHCPNGQLPAANPEYECDPISATLTGLGGIVQEETTPDTRCLKVDFGAYQVQMSSTIGAGHEGRITIQGLGD